MKRPVTPKRQQSSRPKITTRNSVGVRRPSSNHSKNVRPLASVK